jgi:hypothetical protein
MIIKAATIQAVFCCVSEINGLDKITASQETTNNRLAKKASVRNQLVNSSGVKVAFVILELCVI